MMNADFTQALVRERQRDLAQVARSTSLARRVRRLRRKRNPEQARVSQPTAS